MDDLDVLKIGITVGLFFGILFICSLCYFILCFIDKCCKKDSSRNGKNKFFTYMNLFSGGVFFATSLLHLLPEAREEMKKFSELASILFDFPTCEFMVSIGFFLVLFIEQLISKLHKIFEARKKAKSLLSKQTHIFMAEALANVTTDDATVEHQKKKKHEIDENKPESLFAENRSESEKWDNKCSSIIICNDESCTNYNVSSIENLDSLDAEFPSQRDIRDDDFVDISLFATNKNEISSSNNDGASMKPYDIINNSNSSTLISQFHESSTHDFQSENSYTNYNPEFFASRLPYCNCSLNRNPRYKNPDKEIINTTKTISNSYIRKAIESSDSLSTIKQSTREGYRAMILLISLLFHSLFDGLALGLQTNSSIIYTILIAIFFHKSLVALSLTLKFYRAFPGRFRLIFLCFFLFSIISPVGCLIGWLVSGSDSIHIVIRTGCSGILQSLSTGTFLFVTFIEILGPELGHGQSKLISIFFVLFGFLLIAILKMIL